MSDTKEQILSFFRACDELKKCKFIMATERIRDILKSIVNSPDLYNLFNTVTNGYNYTAEKPKCLLTVGEGANRRHVVLMPPTAEKVIAFTFCLLAEFDNNTMDFNEFLRVYFPEDGSYFTGFQAFCNTVIKALRDAVYMAFKAELEQPSTAVEYAAADAGKGALLSAIGLSLSKEKEFISSCEKIPGEEKEGAYVILSRLYEAVKSGDRQLVSALACGYNYFVLYYGCISEGIPGLMRIISEYGKL